MIAVANREGYAGANVAAVIEAAGVSRPTFYQHFSGREQCFVAAIDEVHATLIDKLRAMLARSPAERGDATAVETIVAFARSEPARTRFLMSESLAGGAAALDARDRSVKQLAEVLDRRRQALGPGASAADLPSEIVIGATFRMLGSRLRRGERALSGLTRKMLCFIGHYERPMKEHRWLSVAMQRSAAASPARRNSTLLPPAPLPPGRPRIGEDAVAENHRLRIMFATAELVREEGYAAATIAEITKRAGVDGRVFYRMFADKQEAFSAIHELGFQQLMAATAGAFFAAELWPERLWKALGTLADWLDGNPAIAHVGFVESYAVGPGAVQRVEDSLIAFTIFLQEGYQHRPIERSPSHEALEAIVTGVFEIVYRELRHSEEPRISATLPALTYVSLAPFLGVGEADRFIDAQLANDAS
jgi:AcrR family transcriptional regulator